MADISKINPGNGTTYIIKDASAVSNLTVSGTNLTVTRRNNTTFNVGLPSVSVTSSGTALSYTSAVTLGTVNGVAIKAGALPVVPGNKVQGHGMNSLFNSTAAVGINPAINGLGYNTKIGSTVTTPTMSGAQAKVFMSRGGVEFEFVNSNGYITQSILERMFDGKASTYIQFSVPSVFLDNNADGLQRYNYSATKAYTVGDFVRYTTANITSSGGSDYAWYRCLKAGTGNAPSGIVQQDNTYWEYMSAIGAHYYTGVNASKLTELKVRIYLTTSISYENGVSIYWRQESQKPKYVLIRKIKLDGTLNAQSSVIDMSNQTVTSQYFNFGSSVTNDNKTIDFVFTGFSSGMTSTFACVPVQFAFTGIVGGLEGTIVNRGGGRESAMYGLFLPYKTDTLNLGNSTYRWNNLYAKNILISTINGATPALTDTKQFISPAAGKIYLTGVISSTSITDFGYSNASVYMLEGGLNASSLKATNLSVTTATISTATISTLNGSTVPNNPKFSDTVYTHPTINTTATNLTATLGHGEKFTVVESVFTNTNGHVTKIGTKTFTLPDSGNTDTKQTIAPSAGKIYLTGVVTSTAITDIGYSNASVYMLDGGLNASSLKATNLSVTTATISTINGSDVPASPKFTDTLYTHPTITATTTTSTATLGHSETFTVVESVTTNTNGHVTKIGTKTFTLPDSGNTDEKVKVIKPTAGANYPLMAVNSTNPSGGGTYEAACDTGITMNPITHLVSVSGKVNAAGGFFQTSDINKKNIIGDLDLDKAYDLINKCQTILYTLKDDDGDKELIGLIAQEVKEFFPELITEDNDGTLSLDYSRLTVVILKVLKDIINRIKILESK